MPEDAVPEGLRACDEAEGAMGSHRCVEGTPQVRLRDLADYISEGEQAPSCVRVFVGEHVGDTDVVHDPGCEHSPEGGQSDG